MIQLPGSEDESLQSIVHGVLEVRTKGLLDRVMNGGMNEGRKETSNIM